MGILWFVKIGGFFLKDKLINIDIKIKKQNGKDK